MFLCDSIAFYHIFRFTCDTYCSIYFLALTDRRFWAAHAKQHTSLLAKADDKTQKPEPTYTHYFYKKQLSENKEAKLAKTLRTI